MAPDPGIGSKVSFPKGGKYMGIFGKKVKEEPKKEPEPVAKPAAKTETKKAAPAAKKESSDKPKVWHITKRDDDGKWQVKAEGAEKATKLFRTKAEAEDYVKTLKNNNEGSRVVTHKKTGEFQKK
jgi:hypothetical protein